MTTTLSRLLLLSASAAALSACATVDLASLPQPKYATRIEDLVPGPTAPAPVHSAPASQPVAEPEPPTVRAAPSGQVTSEALPPPPSAAPAPAEAQADAPAPPKAAAQPAPAAARPAASGTGGLRYTIQPGDTLSGVGRRFAVPVRALIELNGLPADGKVRSGQKLVLPPEAKDRGTDPYASGPASGEPAVRMAEAAPSRPAPAPVRRDPTPVRAESVRAEPAPVRTEPAPTPAETRAKPPTGKADKSATTRAEASPPAPPAAGPAPVAPIIATAPPVDPAVLAGAVRGRFVWPLKGEILSRFGALGQGLRNDGVNIGAPAGTAVKAADAGEVVYAGDSVPGFGNLVLIKHADGWVTAYGHLGRIDVKMRQQIARGGVIGQVGQTGGVDRPQLHFEMRYAQTPAEKARPLDPLPLLQ